MALGCFVGRKSIHYCAQVFRPRTRATEGLLSSRCHTAKQAVLATKYMIEWPEWWNWELELSQHLLKRMVDRQFNEVDLREMLEQATDYRPNHEQGRWAIESGHEG